jgi:mycofactocin precursor
MIQEGTMEPTDIQDQTTAGDAPETDGDATELVEEELLVEEISIDGMCGVY